MRKAQEVIDQMSKEDKKKQIEEDEKEIQKEVDGFENRDIKQEEREEEEDNASFAKEEPRGEHGDRNAREEDLYQSLRGISYCLRREQFVRIATSKPRNT